MRKFWLMNILLVLLFLQGCDTAKFWNGHYSLQAAYKEALKAEKAYYDKETPEQKELRKKNGLICRKLAMDMYPPIVNAGYEINSKRTDKRWAIEKKCMKERGSPLF